jgi:hypothetical protein
MSKEESLLTPCGRLVYGSLYRGDTTNYEGEPLIYKSGPDKGKPRLVYSFGLAIEKVAGQTHWNQTEWGAKIWQIGVAANPNAERMPLFSWKIMDGDDASEFTTKGEPRKVRICDREGHARHWILRLSSSFIKTLYYDDATKQAKPTSQENLINPGDYVQVYLSVSYNNSQTPGVYLNPIGVCLRDTGVRIHTGVDLTSVGFGAELPKNALLESRDASIATALVSAVAPAPIATQPPVLAPMPAPVQVTPYAAILTPATPSAPAPAPAPAPMPVPTTPVLKIHPQHNPTGTFTYGQMIEVGWNDVTLKQHGMID